METRAQRIIGETPVIPTSGMVKKNRIVTFVRRCIDKNICTNFEHYFELNTNQSISTRNSNISVKVPKIKLEVARNSFYFNGLQQFTS